MVSDLRDVPVPSKMSQLKYAGYSADFLDRIEPNGNIPNDIPKDLVVAGKCDT